MNKRGQSALEVTIFGILLVIILYGMVSYAQRLSYLQQVKMRTFRAALNKAYEKNGVANFLNRHNAVLISQESYFKGHPAAVDSTASVLWQKGISGSKDTTDEQANTYIQSTRQGQDLSIAIPIDTENRTYINFDGTNRTVKTPYGVWKEDKLWEEYYGSKVEKKESASGINYNKYGSTTVNADDTFHFSADTSVYDPNAKLKPKYEFNKGKMPLNTTQSRGGYENWQTPHD